MAGTLQAFKAMLMLILFALNFAIGQEVSLKVSCDFEADICQYRNVKKSGSVYASWTRKAMSSSHDQKGHAMFLDGSSKRSESKIGTLISGTMTSKTGKYCLRFRYQITGGTLTVKLSQLASRKKKVQIWKLTWNQDDTWQMASAPFELKTADTAVEFTGNVSSWSHIAIDEIEVTNSSGCLRMPDICNFDSGPCLWNNTRWSRQRPSHSVSSISKDHGGFGYFMLLENTHQAVSQSAVLRSPKYNFSYDMCIRFIYRMARGTPADGRNLHINLTLQRRSRRGAVELVKIHKRLWELMSSEKKDDWSQGQIPVAYESDYSTFQIEIVGITGNKLQDVIAIDDVYLMYRPSSACNFQPLAAMPPTKPTSRPTTTTTSTTTLLPTRTTTITTTTKSTTKPTNRPTTTTTSATTLLPTRTTTITSTTKSTTKPTNRPTTTTTSATTLLPTRTTTITSTTKSTTKPTNRPTTTTTSATTLLPTRTTTITSTTKSTTKPTNRPTTTTTSATTLLPTRTTTITTTTKSTTKPTNRPTITTTSATTLLPTRTTTITSTTKSTTKPTNRPTTTTTSATTLLPTMMPTTNLTTVPSPAPTIKLQTSSITTSRNAQMAITNPTTQRTRTAGLRSNTLKNTATKLSTPLNTMSTYNALVNSTTLSVTSESNTAKSLTSHFVSLSKVTQSTLPTTKEQSMTQAQQQASRPAPHTMQTPSQTAQSILSTLEHNSNISQSMTKSTQYSSKVSQSTTKSSESTSNTSESTSKTSESTSKTSQDRSMTSQPTTLTQKPSTQTLNAGEVQKTVKSSAVSGHIDLTTSIFHVGNSTPEQWTSEKPLQTSESKSWQTSTTSSFAISQSVSTPVATSTGKEGKRNPNHINNIQNFSSESTTTTTIATALPAADTDKVDLKLSVGCAGGAVLIIIVLVVVVLCRQRHKKLQREKRGNDRLAKWAEVKFENVIYQATSHPACADISPQPSSYDIAPQPSSYDISPQPSSYDISPQP